MLTASAKIYKCRLNENIKSIVFMCENEKHIAIMYA